MVRCIRLMHRSYTVVLLTPVARSHCNPPPNTTTTTTILTNHQTPLAPIPCRPQSHLHKAVRRGECLLL